MPDIAGIGGSVISVLTILFSVLIGGVIIGGSIWLIVRMRRYSEFECVIFRKDGFGQLTQTMDQAGIFVDSKTKNKRLYLKKANVGLNPDKIPYIPGPGGKKRIYMYQVGLKNFHMLSMDFSEEGLAITVGEEDVNWAVNAYERQKKLFQSSLLLQLLPFIALAFVSIIILIIFIYFFKEFKTLGAMSQALKEAALAIAQAQSGTTVIGG